MGNKILSVDKSLITLLMDNSVQTGKVSEKGNIYSEVELTSPATPGIRVFVKVMRPEAFNPPKAAEGFQTATVAKAPVIRKAKAPAPALEVKPAEAKAPEAKPLTAGEKLRKVLEGNPALAETLAAALA